MATKTADDSKLGYVNAVYDELCTLDDAVAKAQDARKVRMEAFRTLQRAGDTTDEMNSRFPLRTRKKRGEAADDGE